MHAAVSQFDDEYGPSHVQVSNDGQSLNIAMEVLRDSPVEEKLEPNLPHWPGWKLATDGNCFNPFLG